MSAEDRSGSRDIKESSRKQKVRHSLQHIHGPQIKDTRLTQSQGYGRRQRSKLNSLVLNVPSIPEDEEVNKPCTPSTNGFDNCSISDQKRKNSETRITNNHQNVSASDSTQTRRDSNCDAFETASQHRIHRTNSSVNSITSPQVQKEQYWWFSKWSVRKNSILVCIIIILSIVIVIQSLFIIAFRH